jgi:hypothetical protein
MITAKIINEFNRGNKSFIELQQEGSLNGTYEELINYTSWVLNNNFKNADKTLLKNVISEFNKTFKIEISKTFLKNLLKPTFRNKKDRINYLLLCNGLKTIPTYKYYNRISLRQYKSNHYSEQLDIIKDNSFILNKQQQLNKSFNLLYKTNKENKITNCFLFLELIEEQIKEEKVLEDYISFICPNCENKFWLKKGTKREYCLNCEREKEKIKFNGLKWYNSNILKFIKEHKKEVISFSNIEFCQEYRVGMEVVKPTTTIKQIKDISKIENLKISIKKEDDLIYLKVE